MGRINLVGLEVEGGWDGEKYKKPFPDIDIIADHSIDGRTLNADFPLRCTHVGEIVSKPMEPDPETIGGWINKYWPRYANNTCGYHIHVSLKSHKDYTAMTTKTFLLDLVAKMQEKSKELKLDQHHYLNQRLKGTNPFSTLNFDASSQIALKQKSVGNRVRYGMLNFAWNIHRTVEWRAFPTFENTDLARTFTFEYISFVETWLEYNAENFIKPYSAALCQRSGQYELTFKTPQEVK